MTYGELPDLSLFTTQYGQIMRKRGSKIVLLRKTTGDFSPGLSGYRVVEADSVIVISDEQEVVQLFLG